MFQLFQRAFNFSKFRSGARDHGNKKIAAQKSKPRARRGSETGSIFEPLEGRQMFSVSYGGGALLTHVEANAVFFGPTWTSNSTDAAEANQLSSFLGQAVAGPYMDQLAEYSTSGKTIGRGTYAGRDTSPAGWTTHQTTINKTTYTTVADSDIRSMLGNEIANGRLPSPDGNRLYVVYVAPNVVVTNGSENSLGDFCGYHSQATDHNGKAFAYAVIVDPSGYPGFRPKGTDSGLTSVQYDTTVTSHELAEAVTDAAPDSGWTASNGDEIGDIAADAGNASATLDGYSVQKLWSNRFNTNYVAPSNTVSLTLTKMGSANYAFALTSAGQLEEFAGSSWSVLDSNVTSVVVGSLNGLNQLFDLHSNGLVYNTIDGHTMVFQGSGETSIGMGALNGTNYLYGLGSNGVLQISHGTGWSTLDTNVTSFDYTTLNGLNQLFDLHSNGAVSNTINGQTMVAQGSGYVSIGVGALNGTNYLFGLQNNGNLRISHGTGWSTLDTNVTAFDFTNLTGLNQLFDLHSNGYVYNTLNGSTLNLQGTGFSSITAGDLGGVNYLFGLGSNGVLQISHGTGWTTLDKGVSSIAFADLNGLNQLFDLHGSGAVENTIDGANLVNQGSGDKQIGIGNLGGTNYLFGLNNNGTLSISHGTGWSTLDTGVTSYVYNNFSGLNQLFDLHSNGLVLNTIDGQSMVFQGSGFTEIGTGNLGGANYLFGLQSSGVLSISHGTGWSTLDTGVSSFVYSSLNGLNQVFDLHFDGTVLNTIDGSNMVFQGSGFSEIGVGNLAGTNYLFGLGEDDILSVSHGTGWSTLDTGVTSFEVLASAGFNELVDDHSNGEVFNTTNGITMNLD